MSNKRRNEANLFDCPTEQISINIKSEKQDHHDLFTKYEIQLNNFESIMELLPFQCSICYEKFGFDIYLERNLVLHFKEYHLDSYIKAEWNSQIIEENLNERENVKNEVFVHPEIKYEILEPLEEMFSEPQTELFQCDLCQLTFKRKSGLAIHMRKHKTIFSEQVNCTVCSRSFKNSNSLSKHTRIHTKQNTSSNKGPSKKVQPSTDFVICNDCNGRFANEEFLQNHNLQKLAITCDKCHLCFCTTKLRFMHKNEVHGDLFDDEFRFCTHCKEAVKKTHYSGHVRCHTLALQENQLDFKCEICNKGFKYKMLYTQHKQVHDEPKYNCDICGKMFYIKRNLEKHRKRKHKCTYKCDICGLVLTTYNKLRVHTTTHSAPIEHRCEQCNKVFKQKASLQEHFQALHSGVKPYKCTECDKAFAVERQCKNHIRKAHTIDGKLQYTCEECGKPMRDKNSLETHLKLHRGIKDHKCDICGRCFSERHNLKDHLRCHANEKAFACTFCDRRFNQQRTLYLHLRIHKGVKNHPCTMCDKSFYQNNQLQRHMWTHTGKPDISCRPCNMSFISLETRKQHNANIHNSPLVRIPLNDQEPE